MANKLACLLFTRHYQNLDTRAARSQCIEAKNAVYCQNTRYTLGLVWAMRICHLKDHIVEDNLPIHDLVSRIEIEKRLAQHARAIDRADEVLLRTAYHEDGTVDYGSLRGTAAEFAEAIAAVHRCRSIVLAIS